MMVAWHYEMEASEVHDTQVSLQGRTSTLPDPKHDNIDQRPDIAYF